MDNTLNKKLLYTTLLTFVFLRYIHFFYGLFESKKKRRILSNQNVKSEVKLTQSLLSSVRCFHHVNLVYPEISAGFDLSIYGYYLVDEFSLN